MNPAFSKEYVIDGSKVTSLEAFYDQIGEVLIRNEDWGRNLDALEDVLYGGFGTPDAGFAVRWTDSAMSRENLGYPETVRQLERRLGRCHPTNRDRVRKELNDARNGQGPTVFDWLVEIIQRHADPEGDDPAVQLVLE